MASLLRHPRAPSCSARFASGRKSRYVLAASARSSRASRQGGPKRCFEHDPFVKACSGVTNEQKYVNMADIIFSRETGVSGAAQGGTAPQGEPIWDVIELLFFAY